jgi:hypothetical protein
VIFSVGAIDTYGVVPAYEVHVSRKKYGMAPVGTATSTGVKRPVSTQRKAIWVQTPVCIGVGC